MTDTPNTPVELTDEQKRDIIGAAIVKALCDFPSSFTADVEENAYEDGGYSAAVTGVTSFADGGVMTTDPGVTIELDKYDVQVTMLVIPSR